MPRIPDDKRAAIEADIRAGQKSRNQIARDHDVSVGSVTNIAKGLGLTTAFDRSATKNATKAAQLDAKARRAVLQHRFLDRAERALDDMERAHLVFNFGGKENTYAEHLLDRPPTGDQRNLMIIAATGLDKSIAIDRHDADTMANAAVDTWLDAMLGRG